MKLCSPLNVRSTGASPLDGGVTRYTLSPVPLSVVLGSHAGAEVTGLTMIVQAPSALISNATECSSAPVSKITVPLYAPISLTSPAFVSPAASMVWTMKLRLPLWVRTAMAGVFSGIVNLAIFLPVPLSVIGAKAAAGGAEAVAVAEGSAATLAAGEAVAPAEVGGAVAALASGEGVVAPPAHAATMTAAAMIARSCFMPRR